MRAKTILLLLIALLFTFVVSAQTRYPKREFRGAWIQCVNGQFQGMPTEKIQRLLINQLNSLQDAGINAIIFRYVQKPMPCINLLMSRGAAFLQECRAECLHLTGTRCSS